jgi:hypothetical protein
LICNKDNKRGGGKAMADSEKLDLILEKVTDLEHGLKDLKRQQMKDTAELKAMDSMILDEVERVHELLIKRTDALEKKII